MRPREIKEFIAAGVDEPTKVPPLFIEGPPGVGKSEIPLQVAQEKQVGWLDTRASQHDPTDFRGIPAVIDGKAVWLPPGDIPYEFNKDLPERGIWMLDEITSAPPLVQAVLYQAVLEKKIAEHPLKKGWYIIAAGNRLQDRAITYRMSSALANRFTHAEFEIDLDAWMDWAKNAKVNPNIIVFLKWKPDLLMNFNPESSEKAFCSPRTWGRFANAIIETLPNRLIPHALEGTLGKGATAEFMAFLKLQTKLPNIETIFTGSNFVPKELDLTYALVGALATRAKGMKDFERMVQYSKHLDTEFAVLLITMLAKKDETTMVLAPSFEKWALQNSDIVLKLGGSKGK